MKNSDIDALVNYIYEALEQLIPAYKTIPEDWNISHGNAALCIIAEDGRIFGKVFGNDKLRQRGFYKVAWNKASQVWITGHKTGDYEKMVFDGNVDPEAFSPIELPDLIGWVGGQPIKIDEGTTLAFGFSGFRGFNDIEIVRNAVEIALEKLQY